MVIYISDYESWFEAVGDGYWHSGPAMQEEWNEFKRNNPNAKLICIDLTPTRHSQTKKHEDVLQVGGFSDKVFETIDNFIKFGNNDGHWLQEIENFV